MTALVDANILLRYFTGDDPEKAERCEEPFQRAAAGEVRLRVSDVCIAEMVWTLDSFYGEGRGEIAEKVIALVNTPGLEFSNVSVLLDAAERFRRKNVDYIDAYHAALASVESMDIYSYDKDFDKFSDAQRKEP